MIAHHYHPDSGLYLGTSEADESPLEPGVFILPAFATFKNPPDFEEGKICVWNGEHWELRDAPTGQETPALTWDSIRSERNVKLAASDWTQLPDAPFTEEQVMDWRAYRQQLRDLPMGEGSPEDVIWPTAP